MRISTLQAKLAIAILCQISVAHVLLVALQIADLNQVWIEGFFRLLLSHLILFLGERGAKFRISILQLSNLC